MGTMKRKRGPDSFPYFFGSVALIVTAIIATAILNRTRNAEQPQDIRARASVASLLRMKAIVTAVDEANGTVTVNGLMFVGNAPEQLSAAGRVTGGEWTVHVGSGVSLGALSPGMRVELQVDPSTFDIAQRTLTGVAITVSR